MSGAGWKPTPAGNRLSTPAFRRHQPLAPSPQSLVPWSLDKNNCASSVHCYNRFIALHPLTSDSDPRATETAALRLARSSRISQSSNWDAVARDMPDFSGAPSTDYYRACEIALLEREIGDLRGLKILKLDLWNEAINTRILSWMQSKGAEVYGMDLSHVVTHRARATSRSEGHDIPLVRADIRDIPFADGTFDFVYTMGTIEHVVEYRDVIRQIRRVLKPGGRAIIGVPHKWDIFLRPLLVAALDAFGKYPYAPERCFSSGELRRDVENAGLQVERRTGILIIPGVLRMADLFLHTRKLPLARMTVPFLKAFEFLETKRPWTTRFGYLIAVVARKSV
jgi:SAM-dependent methyltransferase